MKLNNPTRLVSFAPRRAFGRALALAVAGLGVTAQAGFNQYGIGLNFGSDEPSGQSLGTLGPADTAGVPAVAQANWNNLSLLSGFAENSILDHAGALTSVGVAWTSANTWASWGRGAEINGTNLLSGTPDNVLFIGYLDTGNATTTSVTITNIPSQLTSGGYDVYVYGLSGVGGRGGSYRIVNAADSVELRPYLQGTSATSPTNYIQDVGAGHTNEAGNYMVFRGLTSPGIIVEATTSVNPFSGTPRAPIAAIQLVSASTAGEAPAAAALNLQTNVGPGNLSVSFTPGAGSSGSLVVMRAGQPVTAQPVDGVTYTANTAFGLGTNLGDDDPNNPASPNYVVYDGNGSSVTVTGLDPTQVYHVAVYSYVGSGASRNYTLQNPARSNAMVLNPVTGITLVVPSQVIVGGTRRVSAIATFANGGTADVTAASTYTSSAPAVVSFPANNAAHLAALSTGAASVWVLRSPW